MIAGFGVPYASCGSATLNRTPSTTRGLTDAQALRFPVSNYTNMVELALLEKGLPFEYVLTFPEQTPEFLARSPRGKVPFLGTPQGFINEADAILDYLEDIGPARRLLPEDPQARATVRALMKEIELYIELPARTCFAEAFFGGSVPAAIKSKAREDLLGGFCHAQATCPLRAVRHGRHLYAGRYRLPVQRRPRDHGRQAVVWPGPARGPPAARTLLQRLGENPHVQAIARKETRACPRSWLRCVHACRLRPERGGSARIPNGAASTSLPDHPL